MAKLPVTVVIPHIKSRDFFFFNFCLPSVKACNPAQILVYDGDEHVQAKRNAGAASAEQEFIFFCDDDIVLGNDCLGRLVSVIGKNDIAYCDYLAANHPTKDFVRHTAKEFNANTLRQQNYISTMSLVRKSAFPGFDESVERLQDWDLWLTMLENGSTAIKSNEAIFMAYWIDKGITGNDNWNTASQIIRRKHQL